jgi:hypothetical protein
MTKKVLILSLNYSSTPTIALSGRINIAVNARGVFIADYGILEENITYLTDEWAPLTKVHIMAVIQALVDESTSLEEIYIYYAGYGSGIQIVKSIDWALMPETLPLDTLPLDTLPLADDSTITITIDELEPTTTEPTVLIEPIVHIPYKYDFYPMAQSYDKLTKQMVGSDYEIITNSEILDMLKNTRCRTICVLDMCPLVGGTTEPLVGTTEPLVGTTEPLVGTTEPLVGTTEPLTNEEQSHLLVGGTTNNSLTWGTDIIGNLNIISFAEPDSISSGKLATIQVITQHLFTNPDP